MDKIMDWLPWLAPLLASGPWGVVGVVGGLGLIVGLVWYLVSKGNEARDAADLSNGGADAGTSATELRNQANSNRDYLASQEAKILAEGPPKDQQTEVKE